MSSHSPDPKYDTASVAPINERWSSISKHVLNSYVEANNAFLATMGMSPPSSATEPQRKSETAAEPPVTELAFGDETWLMERSVDESDELEVGDYVRFTKPIAETDVSAFATASGDTNRLHLDEAFAGESRFGGRIAHGTLVAGTISAALARFPGVTIYLSQDLEFLAPVEVGETVTAECEILEALGDERYRLRTTVSTPGTEDEDERRTVVDGEAVVAISSSPDE
ncbi:MaoC family dehydratase [Natronobacterium texcoconense]|uniref:Acyl dehydratase n=1 Tax=Natronobacterium texcoconense TaxID=1095778 RepID=A0A1H1B265_NATTX|nr:MaoC family dehydratase [Natronobacterium texcoconense]SDQ46010.1 Acyl dehydratase [Natronobacterium texcoconense]